MPPDGQITSSALTGTRSPSHIELCVGSVAKPITGDSRKQQQNIEQQIEYALKDLKGLKLQSEKTDQGSETKACRHKAEVSYNKSLKVSFDQMNSTNDTLDKEKNQKQATEKHEHQNQNKSSSFNCYQNKKIKTNIPKSNSYNCNKNNPNYKNQDQKLLVKNKNCYNNSCKATYQDASYYQDQNFNDAQEHYANPSQISYNPGNYHNQNFEQNYNQQENDINQYYNYGAEFYQNNNNSQNFVDHIYVNFSENFEVFFHN